MLQTFLIVILSPFSNQTKQTNYMCMLTAYPVSACFINPSRVAQPEKFSLGEGDGGGRLYHFMGRGSDKEVYFYSLSFPQGNRRITVGLKQDLNPKLLPLPNLRHTTASKATLCTSLQNQTYCKGTSTCHILARKLKLTIEILPWNFIFTDKK